MDLATIILTATQFDDLDHFLIIGSFIILVILVLFGAYGTWGRRG